MQDLGQTPRGEALRGACAWIADGSVVPVLAATHEAVGVELPPGAALAPEVEISLGDAYRLIGPMRARLGHVERRANGAAFAVLRLRSLPEELQRRFAELLMSWPAAARRALPPYEGLAARVLDDPARVEAVLEALGAEEVPALVRAPGGSYTGARLRSARLDRASDLPLRWTLTGPPPRAPFTLEIASDDLLYELPIVRAHLAGAELRTEPPASMLRLPVDARWMHRVPPEMGWTLGLSGSAPSPLVRAASGRLAFRLRSGERMEPGRALEALLRKRAGPQIRGRAWLEPAWPDPDSAQTLQTARFEPATPADRGFWEDALERIRNPDTRRAGTWAASLWELYDKSGYFQLSGKTAAHFSHLRRSFAVATRRLDTAPEVGCQVVWPSPERVEAGLSMLFVYAGTAMVYQVARRRDARSPASAREMLRAINVHAFEHVRRDPAFEWTLVYVQEGGARWSHLAYQVFTEAQLPTGLTCVVRFRAMEAPPRAWIPGVPDEPAVGVATEEERALLAAALLRLRPAPYLEALDLVPARFDLRGVRARWAGAGFAREREVLVARRRGHPLAAAVVEAADDALHLFGLLDCVRFYPLAPDGEGALSALVSGARAWFAKRGKQTFVCFFEAESFDAATRTPGLYDLGAANLLAFPRPLLPDFLEHLHAITAPRPEGH